MPRHTIFAIALLLSSATFAQNTEDITGTWKGISICQQKNSPCHDEIAAYHAEKTTVPGQYRFVMNKIVNGVEEEMGVTMFSFDGKKQAYISTDTVRNAVWQFTARGNNMDGTLMYQNKLYRIIKLVKEEQAATQ